MIGALTCSTCGAYHKMIPVRPIKEGRYIVRSEWRCTWCGLINVINHEGDNDANAD
jgi:hypothetical protein